MHDNLASSHTFPACVDLISKRTFLWLCHASGVSDLPEAH